MFFSLRLIKAPRPGHVAAGNCRLHVRPDSRLTDRSWTMLLARVRVTGRGTSQWYCKTDFTRIRMGVEQIKYEFDPCVCSLSQKLSFSHRKHRQKSYYVTLRYSWMCVYKRTILTVTTIHHGNIIYYFGHCTKSLIYARTYTCSYINRKNNDYRCCTTQYL